MTYKVLIADNMSARAQEILTNDYEGIEVDVKTGLSPDEQKAILGDYHGVLVRSSTKLTKDLIGAASNLKVVARAGTGVDNIDIPAANAIGAKVCNTPGGNTVTTAEHAIACMMAISRNIAWATASMKAGKWEKKAMMGHQIAGRTLGVVGLGAIGKVVAERGLALKMNVLGYDPYANKEELAKMGVKVVEMDELLAQSDYVSLHVKLTDETRGLFDKKKLETMKKGAFLICCARGGVVDEDALYDLLSSGHIKGAHLDVFAEEPTKTHKLFELNNFACTPHLGASTHEAQIIVAEMAAQIVGDYLTKGELRFEVKPS